MPSRFGPFEIDPIQRRLTQRGADVHLTPLAFNLLNLLIEQAPRVVTKEELHKLLWPETFVSDASLSSLVKELRRVLNDRDAHALIRTVTRVGYAFGGVAVPVQADAASAVTEAHWVEVGGRRVPLRPGDNLIGRAPDAAVWLDAASVSRQHASIVIDAAGATVSDLGSKNGTRVGDRTVSTPVALTDGDRIVVGRVALVYRRAPGGLPTETQVSQAPPE